MTYLLFIILFQAILTYIYLKHKIKYDHKTLIIINIFLFFNKPKIIVDK